LLALSWHSTEVLVLTGGTIIDGMLPRLTGVADAMAASVQLAAEAGVLIGSGTDILVRTRTGGAASWR
jgi:hypothetical protein